MRTHEARSGPRIGGISPRDRVRIRDLAHGDDHVAKASRSDIEGPASLSSGLTTQLWTPTRTFLTITKTSRGNVRSTLHSEGGSRITRTASLPAATSDRPVVVLCRVKGVGSHTDPVALCVQGYKSLGVVSGPVGTRGSERLLVGDQNEHVDELALGEAGIEERAEPFP